MDIKIEKKKYLVPRKYWAWIGGGAVLIAVLIWLGLSNFSSTLKVDRKGLSIGTVEKAQFNDYVSVDGQVVLSPWYRSVPRKAVLFWRSVDEGAHVNKGDVIVKLSNSNLDLEILNAESELAEKQDMLRNTQISMEQDRLNNSNEELSLSQDVITKRRSYQHQEALHKEELNSREEYLKAKEDYDLAVKKHTLISKRLKKDAQLRRSQMDQMGDNLEAMQKNVQLVRQRKEKLNIRSTISGEIGLLDVELGQSISAGQKIGVINDLSDFKVQAQVDEHYIDG